ncbi:MAG: chlorophyll synthase ChlG [Alphaproteobacteria bacterium]|nr:chlorophyll synthase ChlG [Alphaproteobacteria bacterium]
MRTTRLDASAALELLKPLTWFAPMWAFGCGVVSSGHLRDGGWLLAAAGLVLSGPLVCGSSQAVNDWFDRHVDAINEPQRPIPSGRLPGRWGLYIAIGWTALSVLVASTLGRWGFAAGIAGLAFAWAYSAPPFRLKRNGWYGNTAVAACYEGLPWVTGAAVMAAAAPAWQVLLLAALYSAGAHGIMTLNDFKSVDGDRQSAIRTLPVQLGVARASRVACGVMIVPQLVVVALLAAWGCLLSAGVIALLLIAQLALMQRFLRDPRERAPWYNATGTSLYVIGMLVAAVALQSFGGAVA